MDCTASPSAGEVTFRTPMRRPLVFPALAFLALAPSCQDPTEITVSVTTDAKCTDIDGVSFSLGQLGEALDQKPASSVAMQCDPATGRVGAVVIVPSGARNDAVAFRVTAGFGKPVDQCVAPFGAGCIVARRSLRFIPHTPLFVPIKLSVSCAGVPCNATSTCRDGTCVDPKLDPTQCQTSGGCDLPIVGPQVAHPIALVGSIPAPTGTAQQQHLIFATHGNRWWYFTIDSADSVALKTFWSSDFVTWTPGASLTLAQKSDGEGRNFSVAYADLAGKDVVHLVFSHLQGAQQGAYHARAILDQATIAYGPETLVTSTDYFTGEANPDGPVAAVGTDGLVYVATGWVNEAQFRSGNATVGNMDVYQSTSTDDGNSAGPLTNYVAHSWVPDFVNNRALVALGAGKMLAVWPTADDFRPETSNLSWALSPAWATTNTDLFTGAGMGAVQNMNDWSVCATSTSVVHAVRRVHAGAVKDSVFEHLRFDVASAKWSSGGIIPPDAGANGTGVVLLTNGTKMLLFALSAPFNDLRYTKWDGSAWSAWGTQFAGAPKRAFLSGTGCDSKAHAAITWTEGAAPPYEVQGFDVRALF